MIEDEKRQAEDTGQDQEELQGSDPDNGALETDAPPATEGQPQEEPENAPISMEERIQELAAALAEANDRSLRQLAETENIRRRFEREREESLKYAASGLARDLLNVADNLFRALQAVPEDLRESGNEAAKNFIVGVEMTEKELLSAFEKHGIRRILPVGEKFNHEEHQAMFEVADTGQPAGTVVEMMQPGYAMHERLLRPAMVGVAKGDPEHVDTTA